MEPRIRRIVIAILLALLPLHGFAVAARLPCAMVHTAAAKGPAAKPAVRDLRHRQVQRALPAYADARNALPRNAASISTMKHRMQQGSDACSLHCHAAFALPYSFPHAAPDTSSDAIHVVTSAPLPNSLPYRLERPPKPIAL
ncbi:hypothetical protein [Noviherbaspirillum galbum]|uniref:Uncharacterized protein n=1 Tax=Noviherbaspirillum galbum TaxID=2709383 RepID=A0A6B3SQP1_9BURK|nr:hypothetical protein [Noviherbaspirillum galbum]NEX62961.1 hypothetical protein [Noviherbaspirillum galbum]